MPSRDFQQRMQQLKEVMSNNEFTEKQNSIIKEKEAKIQQIRGDLELRLFGRFLPQPEPEPVNTMSLALAPIKQN